MKGPQNASRGDSEAASKIFIADIGKAQWTVDD
jgi:hypothetical protein